MSKQATIASLVRAAAKTEAEFMSTVEAIFEEDEVGRIWEFFDRLNIPRSQGAEDELAGPVPELGGPAASKLYPFEDEYRISMGIQRFLDRQPVVEPLRPGSGPQPDHGAAIHTWVLATAANPVPRPRIHDNLSTLTVVL